MSPYDGKPTAVLDANVLAGVFHRNVVLSLAYDGLFVPRWTRRILDEVERGIMRITKGEADSRKQRLEIERKFNRSLIDGYMQHEHGLNLRDPDDNHVLAAAIEVGAPLIVTDNIKDFDEKELAKHSVTAVSSDSFIASIIERDRDDAMLTLDRMRRRLRRPPMNHAELIAHMRKHRLPKTASAFEANLHVLE